jgi:hypothetical protein
MLMILRGRYTCGVIARLECDGCGRTSKQTLGGPGRSIGSKNAAFVRLVLRMRCGLQGWGLALSSEDDSATTIDLCPGCNRKVKEKP